MADRTLYVGDTYPPLRLSLVGGSTPLDLRPATSITIHFEGTDRTFSVAATPLYPFQVDETDSDLVTTSIGSTLTMNESAQWNLAYDFASADTASPDVFAIYVVVEWPDGQQTFKTSDTLTVLAP
jgi:hypothetical protein